MTILDWAVITFYLLGMLGIGWYYNRRAETEEDYLLGGRDMNATSVGLSMFAALLSTVSCLSVPGEMIQHGPMIFSDIITYPLVYLIVGWLFIPVFVKLQARSAYEILENRFGLGVRLLGSALFLTLRLVWMGLIVYATTSEVLIPLSGLPKWTTPLACIVLGVVTVIYTSMGGLRAVVVTDVIQESILVGAIIVTLIVISVSLGGVTQWWPEQWMSHWDGFSFGFESENRVTVPMAMLSGMLWFVCTAGSDQIAIQRYLATRDVRNARKVLGVSLFATAVSLMLLALTGLALLAYFRAYPDRLLPGTSVAQDADKLYAHFIVIGFPQGITGLVIAGLLATAMSSLSSGVNSACSVISVDFLDRFTEEPGKKVDGAGRSKIISWIVGILVVVLSTLIGHIDGNLLEVGYKAVNHLAVPLFLLIFMAILVPWATWLGAVASVIASVCVSISIAYFEWMDLSFIWIVPAALAAGLAAGTIMSLIPMKIAGNR